MTLLNTLRVVGDSILSGAVSAGSMPAAAGVAGRLATLAVTGARTRSSTLRGVGDSTRNGTVSAGSTLAGAGAAARSDILAGSSSTPLLSMLRRLSGAATVLAATCAVSGGALARGEVALCSGKRVVRYLGASGAACKCT